MRKKIENRLYYIGLCFIMTCSFSCKTTYKDFTNKSNKIIKSFLSKKHDSILLSKGKTKQEIDFHNDYFDKVENLFVEKRNLILENIDFNKSKEYVLIERYGLGVFKYNSFLFNKNNKKIYVVYNSDLEVYNSLHDLKKDYPDIAILYDQIDNSIEKSKQAIKKDTGTGDDYYRYSRPIVTILNKNKIIDFYEVKERKEK
ncbi:hypothetical protein [Tenacibaculum aiptasiae]|uniref:hypothetical protein n=1 Tax=Tenacibaculum aiptasiae TaxID=426481 RepID=UPI00232E43B8|nr:hypothetical protein [Tenacibaculum aiptasiae]